MHKSLQIKVSAHTKRYETLFHKAIDSKIKTNKMKHHVNIEPIEYERESKRTAELRYCDMSWKGMEKSKSQC